jgi:hypothetical protein
MDLSTFIAETLAGIQKGVSDAIKKAPTASVGGVINPVWEEVDGFAPEHVQKVIFDVAITVADKNAKSVGGGIQVVGVRIGADGSEAAERSHVSRVQFTVPIVPPTTNVKRARQISG